jgi:hypothetical protein
MKNNIKCSRCRYDKSNIIKSLFCCSSKEKKSTDLCDVCKEEYFILYSYKKNAKKNYPLKKINM